MPIIDIGDLTPLSKLSSEVRQLKSNPNANLRPFIKRMFNVLNNLFSLSDPTATFVRFKTIESLNTQLAAANNQINDLWTRLDDIRKIDVQNTQSIDTLRSDIADHESTNLASEETITDLCE